MPSIACKDDTDDLGFTITGECSDSVKINGKPVAVEGSTMDDGAAINVNLSTLLKIDGKPVVIVGSGTEPHKRVPYVNQPGTIQTGDSSVSSDG